VKIMSKIDVISWGKFKIFNLFQTEFIGHNFQVSTGASVEKKYLIDGNTPRITVTGINNGIYGYFDCKIETNDYRKYENFISVSFLGTMFYHPYKATLDMKVHCLKPTNIVLNKYTGNYLITALKKSIQKSSYADQISSKSLPHMDIILPIAEDGEPDYDYMENYMKQVESTVSYSLSNLLSVKSNEDNKINTTNWGDFYINDIFDIDAGNKFDGGKMKQNNPEINFVNRSGMNNGVVNVVDKITNVSPYKEGLLTLSLGGSLLGACFIQNKPFYTGQNMVVLTPQDDISLYSKLYIATAITKESRNNYKAFIKELNSHIKTDFSFKLPITLEGKPNYSYMEQYMKDTETVIKNSLNKLKLLIN
jgi:hypothetical protein